MLIKKTIMHKKIIETHIIIPAYEKTGNGLVVEVKIKAVYSEKLVCHSIGRVAIGLEMNFKRIIEIMSSLKKTWQILKHFHYQLECNNEHYKVSDARSSSLALSIALLNIYKEINDSHQVKNITGTGLMRIDGSFEETYLEQQKYYAVKNSDVVKKFVTSNKCNHIFELENILNQFKHKGEVLCQ